MLTHPKKPNLSSFSLPSCQGDLIDPEINEDFLAQAYSTDILPPNGINPENFSIGTQQNAGASINLQHSSRGPMLTAIQQAISLEGLIQEIKDRKHILNCIRSPPQNFMKGIDEVPPPEKLPLIILKRNFKRLKHGELETSNEFLLKKQRKAMGSLVKDFNKAILTGKPVTSIQLPLDIFIPKSKLEEIAESLACAPSYLETAGKLLDPVEQFKNVIAFWVSTFHSNLPIGKCFDPLKGETFQALIGGIPVYLEQISELPSICRFQMYGKEFKMNGKFEIFEKICTNSSSMLKIGYPKVTFRNGTTIYTQLPGYKIKGVNFGSKTFKLKKKLICCDIMNKLYLEINFEKKSGFFSSKIYDNDSLESNIYEVTDCFIDKFKSDIESHKEIEAELKEKHIVKTIAKLTGSWLKSLEIDGKTIWSIQEYPAKTLENFDNPLPTDSKFRLDILHFKVGDQQAAREEIGLIQAITLKDQKLRERNARKI